MLAVVRNLVSTCLHPKKQQVTMRFARGTCCLFAMMLCSRNHNLRFWEASIETLIDALGIRGTQLDIRASNSSSRAPFRLARARWYALARQYG